MSNQVPGWRAWRSAAVGAVALAAMLATLAAVPGPAAADVLITVDKSTQQLTVAVDGYERYTWPVSTGLHGGPPSGTFRPERMERMWYSRAFGMAPMPHSIFFHGPFAIHGTTVISRLGHPASHGCVRLHPDNATILFELVQREGPGKTRIVVR
jgi:lipoprotein-anchoring transpeptidase ErfK/SrfK